MRAPVNYPVIAWSVTSQCVVEMPDSDIRVYLLSCSGFVLLRRTQMMTWSRNMSLRCVLCNCKSDCPTDIKYNDDDDDDECYTLR